VSVGRKQGTDKNLSWTEATRGGNEIIILKYVMKIGFCNVVCNELAQDLLVRRTL